MIRRLGDNTDIRRDVPHSPLVPNLSIHAGDVVFGFPRDVSMASQFRRVPLASPLAPALGTGVAAARPLLRAPRNMRSDGTLRRSSAGARVPSLSFVGILCSSTMSDNADGTALLFSVARGNLLEILDEALSTMVATETLGVTV